MKPPKAKKIPKELTAHQHTRTDNYYWLKDRENQEVIQYLEEENAYLKTQMQHTESLQEKLYEELVGRIKQTDESVPYYLNGYWYYTRYEEGQEYPLSCRKKERLENPEEMILNVNELAEGHEYYQVGGMVVSPDNQWLAFGVDTLSRRIYTIHFKNLQTGEILSGTIPNTTGSVAWGNDNQTVFYTYKNKETLLSEKIFRHQLGTDARQDVLIYEEKDKSYYMGVYKSKSSKYIIIWTSSTLSSGYWILDADTPRGTFVEFTPRESEMEYSIEHFEDKFYILTNWEAQNFRLMETPADRSKKENWKEVLPHRVHVLLEDIDVFKDFIVLSERENGLTQLRVLQPATQQEYYIDFEEAAYVVNTSSNAEFDTAVLRFRYSSLTTPWSVFDYDMHRKEKTLLKQQEVVGGHHPQEYHTERLFAKTEDGINVPISLVYKKGMVKNGQNPLLLYAYGSYGFSIDPSFSSVRLSLLDRGFVFAIAHIRGGEEMGRDWYEKGKMRYKKNTFTDFIACGEYLIQENYTDSTHLFAEGGSAGGLLMGAVMNLKGKLFKGVIAAVPFVDVVTTMLDDTIPLTTNEYDEWGNPNEEEAYHYMLSYSPYDNVEAKEYPNVLVTTGLHDSQVQYWEPAKWVAKLRELKTDQNVLLLKTDMITGHGGKSGRFSQYRDLAFEYAFLLDLAGIGE